MSEQESSGPCHGLRVVELGTSMVSGPLCGQILGDMGADVIKIEGPGGDIMRAVPPFHQEMSGQFVQFNRNKRSIVLDLKSEKDRDTARSIIARADILVENFRPGVTKRLGLDYDAVKAINDRLIYVSINGFGADGPYAKLPAYDQVIQGIVGFMPFQDSPDSPAAIRSVVVDKVTALSAATAALAALAHRERSGLGQHVEVRMLDAYAAFILPEFLAAHTFASQPVGNYPSNGIYRTLQTADGHLVGLIVQDSQFTGICRALGREDLIDDPRFATTPKRFAAMDALLAELQATTITMTTKALLDILWAKSDVAIAPVNTLADCLDDPQIRHNQTIFCRDDERSGPVRQLAPFATYSGSPIWRFDRAPSLDEHGAEVVAELTV